MNSAAPYPARSVEAVFPPAGLVAPREPSVGELARAAVLLERAEGLDLRRYKPQYAARQVGAAWAQSRIGLWGDYLSALGAQPALRNALRERLSVQHSEFFRNPAVFDLLSRDILPALFEGTPLRILSAGCGRGEEAYSLALALEQSGMGARVEAVDCDARAVAAARRGIYPLERLRHVPEELYGRFRSCGRGVAELSDCVRRRVTFFTADLFEMPLVPARYHLIMLRNVCIYLTRGAQERLLSRLVDSLRPGGILVLGRTESPPPGLRTRLEALNVAERVYRKPSFSEGAAA